MVITIDGLGVNGKTTLAKRISNYLGFKNFNTGAIYRCIALEIMNNKLNINNIENVISNVKDLQIDFDGNNVILNGIDVSKRIREEDISVNSTAWATIPEIKVLVRKIQKDFIKKYDTVIEGRDIAVRIAPDADVKFYLYSDFETRVNRLALEKQDVDINVIRENLKVRDDLDINGGNFVKPNDAYEIDTSLKTIDEVYEEMIRIINENLTKI